MTTSEAYEAAIARLRSLGALRGDLQRKLASIQSREWSRDGVGAQLLGRSLRDIANETARINRQIMDLRARREGK